MEEIKTVETIEQNENVDKVLTSVSDEYLRKKKRNKIITFSSISLFVLALAIVIITLSCVKIDLKPFFIADPTNNAEVYIDNKLEFTTIDDASEQEFLEIYEDSFKTSILTAMFTGKLGDYEINEEKTSVKFYSDTTNGSGMSDTLKNNLGSNYVHLYYGTSQRLYSADGSLYYSNANTNEYQLSYNDVYFNISSENHEHELTFYFGAYCEDGQYISRPKAKIVSITIRANTYSLYKFVTGVEE